MYTDNELLFPHDVIPSLVDLRGDAWQQLIERVMALTECHEETLALMLAMIRLNGCMACETDSFRAMRGCKACAHQTLRRHKGPDTELIHEFDVALCDIRVYAQDNPDSYIVAEFEDVS
jgi:hypothetical protein